jgi:phosphoribosyl 1,2-cyclic phosphodiesterase
VLTDFARNPAGLDVASFLEGRTRSQVSGYGGNTSCVEISSAGQRLIIDGGTGIRVLGDELMQGPCGLGQGEVHLLFTHFHWDHLMGLPFFAPFFVQGNKVHVYSVEPELHAVFQTLFRKPYFPVELSQLKAQIIYHQLSPRQPRQWGDLSVTPYRLDHPDPCWGFKVEQGGRAFSYCVDTECTRVSQADLGLDLPLYQGIDTMIFDAQYTPSEVGEKLNWGHATASRGLEIALREKMRRVIFVHHDPASSDQKIAAAESQARGDYLQKLKQLQESPDSPIFAVEWFFGYEGLTLEI